MLIHKGTSYLSDFWILVVVCNCKKERIFLGFSIEIGRFLVLVFQLM